MKKCARCKQIKDESEFNWRWQKKGRLQSICRSCQHDQYREHYERNNENIRTKAAETKRKAVDEAQYFIYDYLSNHICVDCGEYDFAVLTFDHVKGDKRMDVSTMASQGYSIEALKKEIRKCEVVCFNCHIRRENERRSGGRFRRFWPKLPSPQPGGRNALKQQCCLGDLQANPLQIDGGKRVVY
ncbi:MAG: hypothetical protein GX491_08030 [Chloroflexi bacterium]|nr:hypothetical protein [Chloroflexota bacterium]